MAAVAVCSGLGRKKLTHWVTAAAGLTGPGTHTVLWRRGCSYKQVTNNEDLITILTVGGRNGTKPSKAVVKTENPKRLMETYVAVWGHEVEVKKPFITPVPMENPYKEPLKKCILCEKRVDYKNVQLLSQFISPLTGCIYGRHITGLCGKKQKEITKAIKRAQIMGFMPVMYKDPSYLKDPKVCNIRYRE